MYQFVVEIRKLILGPFLPKNLSTRLFMQKKQKNLTRQFFRKLERLHFWPFWPKNPRTRTFQKKN